MRDPRAQEGARHDGTEVGALAPPWGLGWPPQPPDSCWNILPSTCPSISIWLVSTHSMKVFHSKILLLL